MSTNKKLSEAKQKCYNLGNIKVTARLATQDVICNCCLMGIHVGVEYRGVQRLSTRQAKEGQIVRLHIDCFRSLMRNIRNSMEMLTIETMFD